MAAGLLGRSLPPARRRARRWPADALAKAGFTLVELMVVIAVMMILLAIVVPSYQAMSGQSQRNTCAANLKAIGQALALFREDYQCYPPDSTEYLPVPKDSNDLNGNLADVTHAAYDPQTGDPVNTGVHGLGLYTLYYLGIYSSVLPPRELEPEARLGSGARTSLAVQRDGLRGLKAWFRGGGYITRLEVFHCPANNTKLKDSDLTQRDRLPTLGGWNNYDMFYRRNFWNPGTQNTMVGDKKEDRNLLQAYPPADTVVTWCPRHRQAPAPAGPGVPGRVTAGDKDLVLFVDGSVRRMTSAASNEMYREVPGQTGWPAGPIM